MSRLLFKQQYSIQKNTQLLDSSLFRREVKVKLPSTFGDFTLLAYENSDSDEVHLALVKGDLQGKTDVPMRVHSSCITGDILGSLRCDCRQQLLKSLKYIEKKGEGIVIYAFQEGRGIGLVNKLRAYYLQERGLDTVEANIALGLPDDMRDYSFVKPILDDLGVVSVKLLTNNPSKVSGLSSVGVIVSGTIKHEIKPCEANINYLKTKKEKMQHKLSLV